LKFQASTFFAAGQLRYEWNITDLAVEKVIYSQNTQNITFKFPRSGKYAIKLKTSDPAGREDLDTAIVSIESRNPVAQFNTRVPSPELPNTYVFDATTSYDPDSMDSSRLTFDWTIDGQRVELENPSRNGALGKYTFNTLGTHNITLDITNNDGKVSSNKQTLLVTSLLAVKLRFTPRIVKAGAQVTFIAEAEDARVYEWNF
jgi:PKD repeat protein